MNTFTFVCEEGKTFLYPHHNDTKSSVTFKAVSLEDVVSHFEMFLKGCGYELPGVLEFVEVQEHTKEDIDLDGRC